jgi:hypothetical protein
VPYRVIKTLFVLIALSLVSIALATYDGRLVELKKQLADSPDASENDKRFLTKTYEEYHLARDRSLTEFLNLLRLTAPDKQAEKLKPLCETLRVSISAQDRSRLLLMGIKTNNTLYAPFTFEEGGFVDRLLKSTLLEKRDEIIELQKNLEARRDTLEQKWQGLNSTDGTYDEKEKAIAVELRRAVEEMLSEVAQGRKTWKERIGQAISVAGTIFGGVGTLLELIATAIEKTTGGLIARKNYVLQRVNDYKALVGYEKNGIYVLFRQTYDETKEFIEKNGFDRAKTLYGKARDEASSLWASGTPAQAEDAKKFTEEALKALSDHLANTEQSFNKFVTQHKGKFFGPLGPDLEEALAETRTWEREADDMKRLDLEGKLREWRNDFSGAFIDSFDLSKFSEEDRKKFKTRLRDALEPLVKALKEGEEVVSNNIWTVTYLESREPRLLTDGRR